MRDIGMTWKGSSPRSVFTQVFASTLAAPSRLGVWPPLCLFSLALISAPATARAADTGLGIFARTNLVAWCIVPFDARKRGPEERARMLAGLGLRRLAYDWRAEHIPTFEAEIDACTRNGIELTAWWFPGTLDQDARTILSLLERRRVKTQLWVTGGGGPVKDQIEQTARVKAEAGRIRPIAEAASRIGCSVGLYNHGGWFGEPENQIAIIESLSLSNVGLVYNLHHGHDHLNRFPALFGKMQPHLLAVNLNGMVQDGDKQGRKILHLGEGDRELDMLRVIAASGWRGPVGILDHREETDSQETLRKNLEGLDRLLRRLEVAAAPAPSGGEAPRSR